MAQDAMEEFWSSVDDVQSAMMDLKHALIDAQRPHDSARDELFLIQEKVEFICNVIHEGVSDRRQRLDFLEKRGIDTVEMEWEIAEGLMDSLPEKWQEVEVVLVSVSEGSVTETWGKAKDAMESLAKKWEGLSTAPRNVE